MNSWSNCFSQNTNKKLSRFLSSLHRAEILTFFRSYFGKMMTSLIHSEIDWPLETMIFKKILTSPAPCSYFLHSAIDKEMFDPFPSFSNCFWHILYLNILIINLYALTKISTTEKKILYRFSIHKPFRSHSFQVSLGIITFAWDVAFNLASVLCKRWWRKSFFKCLLREINLFVSCLSATSLGQDAWPFW